MTARRAPEIKTDLLSSLKAVGDVQFEKFGFFRPPKSLSFCRKQKAAIQKIHCHVDYHPKGDQTAEIQFMPYMELQIDAVSKLALELANSDKAIFSGHPELIVNQPIHFAAPKNAFVRWFASGQDEMSKCLIQIADFADHWVVPFFDQFNIPEDIIRAYSENDSRMIKQHHWYVYVAAAYLIVGKPFEAMNVLDQKLGSTGLRKEFGAIFDSVRKKMNPQAPMRPVKAFDEDE